MAFEIETRTFRISDTYANFKISGCVINFNTSHEDFKKSCMPVHQKVNNVQENTCAGPLLDGRLPYVATYISALLSKIHELHSTCQNL